MNRDAEIWMAYNFQAFHFSGLRVEILRLDIEVATVNITYD